MGRRGVEASTAVLLFPMFHHVSFLERGFESTCVLISLGGLTCAIGLTHTPRDTL
jgi:hypothetical protein